MIPRTLTLPVHSLYHESTNLSLDRHDFPPPPTHRAQVRTAPLPNPFRAYLSAFVRGNNGLYLLFRYKNIEYSRQPRPHANRSLTSPPKSA